MVIDRLENIENILCCILYLSRPLIFKSHDLHSLEIGKTELKGKDLLVNVAQTNPKEKENAKLETHKDYIDIQIPLSGTEIMGYTAAQDCLPVDAPYNAEKTSLFLKDWRRTILQ